MLPEYFGGLNSATNTQSQKNHACPLPTPLSVGSLRSTKVSRRVALSKGGSPVSGVGTLSITHHGMVKMTPGSSLHVQRLSKRVLCTKGPLARRSLSSTWPVYAEAFPYQILSMPPFGRWLFARSGDAVDWARLPLQPRPHSTAPITFFAPLRTPLFILDDISLICLIQHSFPRIPRRHTLCELSNTVDKDNEERGGLCHSDSPQ